MLPAMMPISSFGEATPLNGGETPVIASAAPAADKQQVQVALLLDTSGSMKGLIDQARCQLWNVVSELGKASRQGEPIELQISVYQYGSSALPASEGRLRQVVGFTDNLDEVSSALFSLNTGGSDEFCGQVIQAAVNGLEWSEDSNVYKAIFIAGNESFDQGKVGFGELLSWIDDKSLVVNTIYCGAKQKGDAQWRSAAGLTGGLFAKIDHNHHLPEMETPYDVKMRELNRRMNETFVWFGDGGEKAAVNQRKQDANAANLSDHAFAARMSAKIGHLYHHVHHDLVDAIEHGKADLANMSEEQMPPLMAKMSAEERIQLIEKKTMERQTVRREMADVVASRHRFLEAKMKVGQKQADDEALVLGDALVVAIREQAKSRGYLFNE